MFKKLLLICTLLLALPAFANATWYVAASTSPSTGGTITNPGTKSYADTTLTAAYTVTPAANYTLSSVRLGGVALTPDGGAGTVYTISKAAGTRYLVAYFTKNPSTASITPSV